MPVTTIQSPLHIFFDLVQYNLKTVLYKLIYKSKKKYIWVNGPKESFLKVVLKRAPNTLYSSRH